MAINAFAVEIVRAKTKRDAAPVMGASAQHPGPEPLPISVAGGGVRFAVDGPSSEAGVELSEGTILRGGPAARGGVVPVEHGAVLLHGPLRTGLQHHHVGSGFREDFCGHAASSPGPYDTYIIRFGRLLDDRHTSAGNLQKYRTTRLNGNQRRGEAQPLTPVY